MNIAFLSYEYPPETAGGGIGTYLTQITLLLRNAGHQTTVFCGTSRTEAFWQDSFVFRIPCSDWYHFDVQLPSYFDAIHKERIFDVVEGIDFGGGGLHLKQQFPGLPLVIKLHTPLYLVQKLLFYPLNFKGKLRFAIGAIRRLQIPCFPKAPKASEYPKEFEVIKIADRVSSPSESIAEELSKLGFELGGKTDIVPLPIMVTDELKAITARKDVGDAPEIVFIGRLELRKGVIDLAKSIPLVLKTFPKAKFTFIGYTSRSPKEGLNMEEYLRIKLKNYLTNIQFIGGISHNEVLSYLAHGDIFVFPSHYESFGIACCEAMAAGKAVIGSLAGGMAEIIEPKKSGLLVPAKSPGKLAKQIILLASNQQLRLNMGIAARKRIVTYLNPERIVPLQINGYLKTIIQCNQ